MSVRSASSTRPGRAATFTGSACFDWAGGVTGDGFAAQGNILAGEGVVAAMAEAFAGTTGDLCDRLLAALAAGDAAGGDRRGRQSAAPLVVRAGGGYAGFDDRYIDLRVDDHPDAPAELARVFGVWDDTMLVRDDHAVAVTAELLAQLQADLAAVGYLDPARRSRAPTTPPRATALTDWAGWENLEMRLREDDLVSEHLAAALRAAGGRAQSVNSRTPVATER